MFPNFKKICWILINFVEILSRTNMQTETKCLQPLGNLTSCFIVLLCKLNHFSAKQTVYTENYFCYNYAKLPPNLIIFGIKMANSLKLYEVFSDLVEA